MDHSKHEPGTVADCEECRLDAYEPGWYATMRQRAEGGMGFDESLLVLPELNSHHAPEIR